MADDSVYSKGLIYDSSLPTASSNDEWRGARQTRYNERFSQSIGDWRYARCREQTYFIAHNPTIDAATTLAGHAAPVLADADATLTKPLVFLRMADAATTAAELDFIEIDVITAGATGTSAEYTIQLDSGTTRVTTAGTDFTRINPNMNSSATPSLAVQGGAVVVGAETSACRVLQNGIIRSAIEFAGDRTLFKFGGEPSPGANVVAGAASRHLVNCPPVILGATDSLLLALYAPAQNAAGVYRIRMGWSER